MHIVESANLKRHAIVVERLLVSCYPVHTQTKSMLDTQTRLQLSGSITILCPIPSTTWELTFEKATNQAIYLKMTHQALCAIHAG